MSPQRRLLLLRLLLWAAILFAVTMALLPKPPVEVSSNDKVQHMLAFATIAGLAALAHPRTPLIRLGEHLSFLGALIEVAQAWPSLHRDCDIRDWIADTIAVAVVLGAIALVRRRAAA